MFALSLSLGLKPLGMELDCDSVDSAPKCSDDAQTTVHVPRTMSVLRSAARAGIPDACVRLLVYSQPFSSAAAPAYPYIYS